MLLYSEQADSGRPVWLLDGQPAGAALEANASAEPTGDFDLVQSNFNRFDYKHQKFSDFKPHWHRKDWPDILYRSLFVAPIVLLGIVGNLTIIYSMCRFKSFRSKATNLFILNMAIADLLTTIVCPNAALLTYIHQFYILGSFMCRFEGFAKITCLLVSSYSLIVLSFDWLLCVVKPCRKRISIRQSWFVLAAIWIVSIIMAVPLFVWRELHRRQWADVEEVWCNEMVQFSKYYWLLMTFVLILPTVIMVIVLRIILMQMDKFENKLRRSQCQSQPNAQSFAINMKYRRRIVKILCAYLLTSIICWTPLQVCIMYRHLRTSVVVPDWFIELAFYSQICASLNAAMNPIIFGFLSQPFRRILTKSWMFRFVDKIMSTNTKVASNHNNNQNQNHNDNQHHHNGPDGNNAKQNDIQISSMNRQAKSGHQSKQAGQANETSGRMGAAAAARQAAGASTARLQRSQAASQRSQASETASNSPSTRASGRQQHQLQPLDRTLGLAQSAAPLAKGPGKPPDVRLEGVAGGSGARRQLANSASSAQGEPSSKRVAFSSTNPGPRHLMACENEAFEHDQEPVGELYQRGRSRAHLAAAGNSVQFGASETTRDSAEPDRVAVSTTSFVARRASGPNKSTATNLASPTSVVSIVSINIEDNVVTGHHQQEEEVSRSEDQTTG